jgi:hypothetical protein
MSLKTKSYPHRSIAKLDVNCKIYNIRVVESPNDKIEISWSDTVMRSLEIREENDTVKILDHAAIGIYGTLALINLKKDAQLLIKLPSDYSGKAIFQTKEDKVHISDLTTDATIGISSNTGEILLENLCCRCLDVRGNLGKVNAYSLDTTGSVSISTKTGAILCSLLGNEDDYSVSCATNNRRSLSGCTGNGDKKIQLNSERGEIRFAFQNEIEIMKPVNRYDRRNAFKEW